MSDIQQTASQESKSNLNPLLFVVIIIIVAAVGVMLWLGTNKTGTQPATTQAEPTVTTQEKPTEATGSAMTEQVITVEGGEYYFQPNEIRVKQGEKVTITLKNVGKMPHDFVIGALSVQSELTRGGEEATVTFTPDKTGTFEFYCSVSGHRQQGMRGTLIVE